MSGTAESADLYAAIEKSARLLDVSCSPDKVWPILTAYEDVLAQIVIAFRVATGARHKGDLDCRFTMLPKDVDPYARALSNGLIAKTDHSVGTLLSDIRERCPIDCYGIDFGLVAGFTKAWSFFPPGGLQELSGLVGIPSMPPSLGDNADFFARYGLNDKVSLIGIDYYHRTANVYFGELPAESLEPKAIKSMLRETGLSDPSAEFLEVGQKAFNIYVTLNWDSSKIERICFSVITPDPMALPGRLDPKVELFVKNAPYTCAAADRMFIYAVTASSNGEYYKLGSPYQWRPKVLDMTR